MVRKTLIFSTTIFIFFLLVSATPAPLYANAQIPPTAEGPGLILPNSPFFFLDEIKQNLRIILAVRPQDKAEVYNSIAGERIAELRFMLAKDNKKGIEIALKGISENTKASADNLSDAQFRGHNVEKLAEMINVDIKRRQEALDVLLSQATGELKTMVLGTQTSIYDSKTKVVNAFSPSQKEIEMKNDIKKQTSTTVNSGMACNPDLLNKISVLKKQVDEKNAKSNISSDKKNKLTQAFVKLEKAAKQCVESYSAFVISYKEFNELLSAKPQNPQTQTQK